MTKQRLNKDHTTLVLEESAPHPATVCLKRMNDLELFKDGTYPASNRVLSQERGILSGATYRASVLNQLHHMSLVLVLCDVAKRWKGTVGGGPRDDVALRLKATLRRENERDEERCVGRTYLRQALFIVHRST